MKHGVTVVHTARPTTQADLNRQVLAWVMAKGYLLLAQSKPTFGADDWRARRALMETFAKHVSQGGESAHCLKSYLATAAKEHEGHRRFWGAGLCGQVLAFCAQTYEMEAFCSTSDFMDSRPSVLSAMRTREELSEIQKGDILLICYLALTYGDRGDSVTAKKRAAVLAFLAVQSELRGTVFIEKLRRDNQAAVSWKFATEGRLGRVIQVLEKLHP